MTLKERLEFCTICEKKEVDFKKGLVCTLTQNKPDFEEFCDHFEKDEVEAKRKLEMKLEGTGNSRAQHGSLNPKKNKQYGAALTVIGLFVLLFSLVVGGIILASGISFIVKGNQQKKVLKEKEALEKKISNQKSA